MKNLLKGFVSFSLTFFIGIFPASLYTSEEASLAKRKSVEAEIRSMLFNPPKPLKCKSYINELRKKQAEINLWLSLNENASKKQKSAKRKELEEIEINIKVLQNLKDFNDQNPNAVASNLLYKENCYEF
ncbi:MAG TPA: hypothetical protein VF556_08275 [Pyrinomonadaceae bacterium]|jgi:hypothetical protein